MVDLEFIKYTFIQYKKELFTWLLMVTLFIGVVVADDYILKAFLSLGIVYLASQVDYMLIKREIKELKEKIEKLEN